MFFSLNDISENETDAHIYSFAETFNFISLGNDKEKMYAIQGLSKEDVRYFLSRFDDADDYLTDNWKVMDSNGNDVSESFIVDK